MLKNWCKSAFWCKIYFFFFLCPRTFDAPCIPTRVTSRPCVLSDFRSSKFALQTLNLSFITPKTYSPSSAIISTSSCKLPVSLQLEPTLWKRYSISHLQAKFFFHLSNFATIHIYLSFFFLYQTIPNSLTKH